MRPKPTTVLVLLLAPLFAGCPSMGIGPPQPAPAYAKAGRLFLESVGEDYAARVNLDATLTVEQRSNRVSAVADFDFATRQVEAALGMPAADELTLHDPLTVIEGN